jgi:tetratricopeptide (TPR) repeat protein
MHLFYRPIVPFSDFGIGSSQTFDFVSDVIARAASGGHGHDLTVREALQLMLDEMKHRDLPADARSWLTSFIADSHASASDPAAAVVASEQGAQGTTGASALVQARLLEGQAMALEMAGKPAESLQSIDHALAIVETQKADSLQIEALSRLLTMKVRFGIRQRLLPFAEAEALAKRAMSLRSAQEDESKGHLQQRAEAGIALTDVYLLDRRYDDARANLTRVESMLENRNLLGHDMLLDAYLTGQHLVLGDTERVIPAFEALIGKWTDAYGPGFRTVASLKAQYAEALERAGRIDEAIAASEEARRIARRNDAENIDVLDLDRLIARRLLRAGEYERARSTATSLREALATRKEPLARSMTVLAWSLQADADLLEQRPEDAYAAIENAETVLAGMKPDDAGFVRARRTLDRVRADHCLSTGDLECARIYARKSLDAAVSVLDDPQDVLLAHRLLALATTADPVTRADGAKLLANAKSSALRYFDGCNPFVSMITRTEPIPGIAAMALPPPKGCHPS